MKLKSKIDTIIKQAFIKADINENPIPITEATKVEFGDFQFNGALSLAKKLRQNPRAIAQNIMDNIDFGEVIEKVEIAGAGFINIWIKNDFLSKECEDALANDRLGVSIVQNPQKIVVDYSGPNMAKQMHVGHLRSTIIGDSLANLFVFLGNDVLRQNHIGDWGTQFGMLIAYLEEIDESEYRSLSNLEQFYKDGKAKFDRDEAFANKSREYVVKLQQGDEACLVLWQKFIDISLGHTQEVYDKLGVKLSKENVKAESFYNDDLSSVIDELTQINMLVESNGAKCVFLENDETPMIVQKSDGGYLYATTDLSALRYRAKTLKADRISYVVDARQSGHFKQVFQVVKEAKFVESEMVLEHIAFGTMMDKSGKPFKTRDGGTVKLIDLLDEAVIKAKEGINNKDEYSPSELDKIAKIVGIGAVKYADLSINRESNYIFDWDKMLSLNGNTALYIQYAYARIESIFRKYNQEIKGKILVSNSDEHLLTLALLQFEDVLLRTAKEGYPHYLSNYLYNIASMFMRFYESSPVLKDDVNTQTKESRLKICQLTSKTIKQGLDILGIEVVNKL